MKAKTMEEYVACFLCGTFFDLASSNVLFTLVPVAKIMTSGDEGMREAGLNEKKTCIEDPAPQIIYFINSINSFKGEFCL